MDIELVSRHTRGLPTNGKDEGYASCGSSEPMGPEPRLPHKGHRGDWVFHEVQLNPDAGLPRLSPCASTVALVVDCSAGAILEDGHFPAEVRRGEVSLSSAAQLRALRFSGRVLLYLLTVEQSRVLHLANGAVDALPPVFIPPVRVRDPEISQFMHGLRESLAGGDRNGVMYTEAYANSIVLRALRRAGCAPLHAPDYKDPLSSAALKAVLDHMYEHASDSALRSATLARVARLPVDVFRHRFRKTVRKSVHQCLMEIRLELALDHLARTSRPVSQIAMDTGFADHSHFSKVFRERMGRTPSEYREFARGRKVLVAQAGSQCVVGK